MTRTKAAMLSALTMVVLFGGCGENTGGPVGFMGVPKDLKALSLNASTIQLQWSPPDGIVDSSFDGYQIQYLGRDERIPKTSLAYNATSLPQGEVVFTLFARETGGRRSDGVAIRWAAAARFDSTLVVTEYSSADPGRTCCLAMGGALRDPSVISPTAPNAYQVANLYLWGGNPAAGQPGSPLELRSTDLIEPAFYGSQLSGVTHSATTLNYPLAEFPQEFSQQSMPVKDNTIYYVRVLGGSTTFYYARLHVKVLGGVAPNRTIGATISLQRVSALPFAAGQGSGGPLVASAVPMIARR